MIHDYFYQTGAIFKSTHTADGSDGRKIHFGGKGCSGFLMLLPFLRSDDGRKK